MIGVPGTRTTQTVAVALWVASLAWPALRPGADCTHRTLVGGAVALTAVAAVKSHAQDHAQDLQETARLARAAERLHLIQLGWRANGPDRHPPGGETTDE